MADPKIQITWLGHSAFLIGLPDGRRMLTDPWLSNPNCPPSFANADALEPIDLILLSHGHSDHLGEVVAISGATSAPVACLFEVGIYLNEKGLQTVRDMGIGGTQLIDGISITMTQAVHSGSIMDGNRIVYLGGAAGFIVRAPHAPTIYFAGDTALFGDMKMIGEIYKPEIAFLPIGDHYTMGPDTAAIAAQWLGVRTVVPMHWGTFPLLHGTPAQLRERLPNTGIGVIDVEPGRTVEI
jgi:L-ascorbate metabolism protein UlaG (beta-lactamase superfamily)